MIYHVYSTYKPKDPNTARRMRLAQITWSKQPWEEIPITDDEVRCYRDHMGQVPYVRDLIAKGVAGKKPEDIIVFTNSDICVAEACSFKVVMAFQSIDAAYCFRRDFHKFTEPIPDDQIKRGYPYCGSDFYAFRVGWWLENGPDFPDMLLGREAWDSVLRILIEMTHPKQNVTLHNLIYHERHASVWENPQNRRRIPSQLLNISVARDWMLSFGHNPRSIGI
jgi:hypothetical protein